MVYSSTVLITTLIKAAVRSNFLFRHLDDAMLDEVVGYMTPAPVKAGDVVIKQGDKGDFFYVCERGTALLVGNTIADNGLAGVEVGAGGAVEAEENALEGNAEAWVGAAAAVRTVT